MPIIETKTLGEIEVDTVGYGEAGYLRTSLLGAACTCEAETFNLGPADAADIDAAVEAFGRLGDVDRAVAAPRVLANCRAFLDAVEHDEDDAALHAIATPDQVWDFVTPERVQLARADGAIHVALVCDCEWEREHGLQLVYRNGCELVRVSAADGEMTGRSD